jgi:gentisate 1,2-dioxygenase
VTEIDMATRVETPYTRRARYYSSHEAFNIKHPEIPAHVFVAERDRALDPASPTGLVACDLGAALHAPGPLTTPLILARYARIRAGERLATRFAATGELYYVMAGEGETRAGADRIGWEAGDIVCLPGGAEHVHEAGGQDCVLWVITNEPELAFARTRPPAPEASPVEPVHYPADEIRAGLARIHALPAELTSTGKALVFTSQAMEGPKTILPSLTLAMNSLAPTEMQRPHLHNSVAVTLAVQGDDCYSMIGGRRLPWQRWATMITPPGEMHSHHNDGRSLAMFLIVQDGGLHYYTRTMGFSY